MQSEITVEILVDKENLFDLLQKKGFKHTYNVNINDYYYTHFPIPEAVGFRELISNSFLIRCLRYYDIKGKKKSDSDNYTKLIYKKKEFDLDDRVISEKKISCDLPDTRIANEIFQMSGLINWCTKPTTGYTFIRDKQKVFIQEVEGLGLFMEVEQFDDQTGTEDEILDELVDFINELEIPVGENYHESIAYRIFLERFLYKMGKIIDFAKKEMKGQPGHSFDHAERVYDLCIKILKEVSANEKVVLTAALLHDIVDPKLYKNLQKQYDKIRELLKAEDYSKEDIAKIEWLLDNTSYSKNKDLSDNIEAQVLSDADKLDAIGATGLIRTIQFNTSRGVGFEKDKNELKYFADIYKTHFNDLIDVAKDLPELNGDEHPIYHIHRKLFAIPERLYTEFAQKEARTRITFLTGFLEQYYKENNLL